ncbi:MAG: DNA double-strand break repair nuclease NurA [Candidatus Nanohaloarchaea archaeon]|nr:DNA double-strand break repair nuclease NurA [Candidatus Nanohaloarchaea archaeon]
MDVDRIVESIQAEEERKKEEAEQLRETVAEARFDGGVETAFSHTVEGERPDDFTVAAVDGGLAREELHGLDLVLRRGVASVFRYRDGTLEEAEYIPGKNPSPEMEYVTRRADRTQVDRLAALLRLQSEIEAALDAVGEADLLLLDGSVLPQQRDRPDEDSAMFDRYEELVEQYTALYDRAAEHGTTVAGVVEDARSSRMCRLLEEHGFSGDVLEHGRDTVLLTYLLDPGERTMVTQYRGPAVGDIGDDGFYLFYLRTVEKDRPVRVEFHSHGNPVEEADAIASRLLSLCGEGSSYGIPPVLIEADQRAKLGGNEVDLLTKRIKAKLAHLPGIENLRRDRRPF